MTIGGVERRIVPASPLGDLPATFVSLVLKIEHKGHEGGTKDAKGMRRSPGRKPLAPALTESFDL